MSAQAKTPLFGRAWELLISSPDDPTLAINISSSAWDPEALRIVFEVNMQAYTAMWYARIAIYNGSADLNSTLLQPGAAVILKAGYQLQPYGTIFQGTVYQATFERENVTDYKVTLLCYTGLKEKMGNLASFRGTTNATQTALVQKMAAAASTPLTIGSIDTTALSKTALPRRRAFFGSPNAFVEAVAAANNMQGWYGFDGLCIGDVQAADAVSTITYTETTGIIGSPQQTQDGVEMQVLLDPRLRIEVPAMQIDISNSQVRQQGTVVGAVRPLLDTTGLYLVMGLNFVGDTRGSGPDWYTQIVAATSVGGKLAMLADAGTPKEALDRRAVR